MTTELVVDTEAAPAKINLHLHVTGRRSDGYHLLDSLVIFAGIGDRLSYRPATELSLDTEGPFAAVLARATSEAGADNLVLRGARALAARHSVRSGAYLVLQKNLPVGSGIGGGSADAAACLRLLARNWQLPRAVPSEWLVSLGADVPVCFAGMPMVMQGIGERLSPAPVLPRIFLVLANPGVAVATASVFRARPEGTFRPAATLPAAWHSAATMARDLRLLANDLEAPAIAIQPVIGELLKALATRPGCLLARMSGSGATCFGLFPSGELADAAARSLAGSFPWVWAGAPASPTPVNDA